MRMRMKDVNKIGQIIMRNWDIKNVGCKYIGHPHCGRYESRFDV
jgi:4-hydroxy-3-methylbut-2-en-1-yl diphosphate synthase IspG/GcpE